MKLGQIKNIETTWVCPRQEDYGIYSIREGTLEEPEPGKCIRCMFKNLLGDEEDFEVTIRTEVERIIMLFDYDGEPTRLPLEIYRSDKGHLLVHQSTEHRLYMTVEMFRELHQTSHELELRRLTPPAGPHPPLGAR